MTTAQDMHVWYIYSRVSFKIMIGGGGGGGRYIHVCLCHILDIYTYVKYSTSISPCTSIITVH